MHDDEHLAHATHPEYPREKRPRKRARRVVRAVLGIVGLGATFVAATAGGAILHVSTRAARDLTARITNSALHDAFEGQIVVERIGHVGLGGASGVRARVLDPDGRTVLVVDGVEARIGLSAAIWSLLRGGDVKIVLPDVTVAHVEATLLRDPSGAPSLARAFSPKKKNEPKKEPESSRGVVIDMKRVRLRHAWAHGEANGTPIDVELEGLEAKATIAPSGIDASLGHLGIDARAPLPREARLTVTGKVAMPTDKPLRADARLGGTVGPVVVTAEGAIDDKDVRLVADVPNAEAVRALFPTAPVYAKATAHADVTGKLPHLVPKVHATLGDATLDVDGDVNLGDTLEAKATVTARGVDLRALSPTAPASRLGAVVHANAAMRPGGAISGRYDVSVPPGVVAAQRVPAARVAGAFTQAGVTGELKVDEPGLPTRAKFAARPTAVDFDVTTDAPDLMKIARIGPIARGTAKARVHGRLDVTRQHVDAFVNVEGRDLARGELTLDGASVDAHVAGPVAAPRIDALIAATRNQEKLLVRAKDLKVGGGVTAVREIVVEGMGQPIRASARVAPGAIKIDAEAPDVDLVPIARFLGKPGDIRSGHVALVAHVEVRGADAKGQIDLDAKKLDVAEVHQADAHLSAKLDGRKLALACTAAIPDTANVKIDAPELTLGGRALDARSWKRATGEVALDSNVDLARAAALVPIKDKVGELAGKVEVHAKAMLRETPYFELSLATQGLVAQGVSKEETSEKGEPIAGKPPWRTEGLDVKAFAATDADSGDAHLQLQLVDTHGPVFSFAADAPVPLEALRERQDLGKVLKDLPIAAHASVPRRALAKMPHIVPRAPVEGDVQLDVDVRGTASKPSVTVAARGFGLHAPRDVAAKPFDAAFDATYDGARAAAKAHVQRQNASLLDAHAEVDVAAPDLLAGKTDAWTASAGASLHDFPLQSITAVGDKHVRGDLSGSFELKDLHENATVDAHLDAKNLKIGRAKFTHGLVTVAAKDGALDAHVRLDQTDGYGDVHATAGLAWGAQVAPSLDPARPIEIGVDAKQLRAAAAKPFVEGAFSELDGRVDANLKMTVRPDKTGQASGAVVFDKGILEMPAIGEELKNAHAKVSINPWGTVRVDDVSADGSTGHFKAWGTAKVDGLDFKSAEGHVRIDRGEAMPISVQGVSMGEAWGSIDVAAAMKDDALNMDVKIPSFHLDLPQSTAHAVQSLDPDPTIKIGVKRQNGRFVAVLLEPPVEKRASNATHLHIATHLGDDIEIKRDHTMQIYVTGSPVIDVAETAKVSGQINLVRGKIEVQGKIFQIEKGTVNFTGQESSNPVVVATAYYDAPDGTRVFADFTGPVKTGKLTLRSEPSHTQDEILAILLFGSPEGSFGASAPPGQDENAAAKAAGLGGSYVAQGINKALSGISNVDVATRVDTSESNNPRPELEVQLSKDVAVQVVYNMGVPGPGQIPDRTLLMIDWRFVRRWMVETTIGDAGSSMVDLIWRYRY